MIDMHILILPASCYSSTTIYPERVMWMRSRNSELAYSRISLISKLLLSLAALVHNRQQLGPEIHSSFKICSFFPRVGCSEVVVVRYCSELQFSSSQ